MIDKVPSKTRGTMAYFKSQAWSRMINRCRNCDVYVRRGIKVLVSIEEFYSWCDMQEELIMSLYKNTSGPSIDRLNNYRHYELSNMQIIDTNTNRAKKDYTPIREATRKPIILIHPNGQQEYFISGMEAVRKYGLKDSNLSAVLLGKRKTHHGFTAKFVKELL